ncbi:MAG: cupin domain-containing protein [Candidatus Roizmanbacteria bacterium]
MKLYCQELLTSPNSKKGWYVGSWNNTFPFPVGYANAGVDEPHMHNVVTEVFLIGHGTSELRIEKETIQLKAGDMIVVECGEAHTFLSSSDDYLHFVFHYPGLNGEELKNDKVLVPRERLGL